MNPPTTHEGVADQGEQSVLVVGAGLSGTLLATLLARRGYRVRMLERRTDPRSSEAEAGRSINLALSARGVAALEAVGLRPAVESMSTFLHGRLVHARNGSTTYQPYGRTDQGIRSVTRADLNTMLLDAADAAGVTVRFGAGAKAIDLKATTVTTPDGTVEQADVIVGADGAFSTIRRQMQRRDRVDFAQSYLSHGYKELRVAPDESGASRYRLRSDVMHIWPRGSYMLMAMANSDASFTVTLYLPFQGPLSFATLGTADEIGAFFRREFPDIMRHLPDLVAQFLSHPTGSLVTIRTAPWSIENRVVLIGDACHAVVPFYGQGANAAFEDCLILDRCLQEHPHDRGEAFREYERQRKVDTDALADLAIANFLEMRDTVSSPMFQGKKRLERLLHRAFPRVFLPLYTMISFTRIPYATARRRAQIQWRVVQAVTLGVVLVAAVVILWRA